MSTLRTLAPAVLAATVALSACSYGTPERSVTPPPAPVTIPATLEVPAPLAATAEGQSLAFLTTLDGSGIEYPDREFATGLGRRVCMMLVDGWTPEKIVSVGMGGYLPVETDTIISAAVWTMCPAQSYKLN